MTSIYQYLHTLVTPSIPGGIFLGAVRDVPEAVYVIVDEGLDQELTPFFTGGRTADEPMGTSSFLLTINLFGTIREDYPALTPIYQEIKADIPMRVDSHPGLTFAGITFDSSSLRPSYNSAVDRAYAAIRFNVKYYT